MWGLAGGSLWGRLRFLAGVLHLLDFVLPSNTPEIKKPIPEPLLKVPATRRSDGDGGRPQDPSLWQGAVGALQLRVSGCWCRGSKCPLIKESRRRVKSWALTPASSVMCHARYTLPKLHRSACYSISFLITLL